MEENFYGRKKYLFITTIIDPMSTFLRTTHGHFPSSFAGKQISLLPLTLNFAVIGFELSQQMMQFFHSLTSKMVKHKKNSVKSYLQS